MTKEDKMIMETENRVSEKMDKARAVLRDNLYGLCDGTASTWEGSDFWMDLESLSLMVQEMLSYEKKVYNATQIDLKHDNPYALVEEEVDEWLENYGE
jgi:hypothetical protein